MPDPWVHIQDGKHWRHTRSHTALRTLKWHSHVGIKQPNCDNTALQNCQNWKSLKTDDFGLWVKQGLELPSNLLARIPWQNKCHRKRQSATTPGMLATKTQDQVLEAIKKLAVREENAIVARVQLSDMKQDRDETIRNFGARLRGQASVCKFIRASPSCSTEVKYTDNILRDVLIWGLADNEIHVQLDLLGDKNQDISLEEVFQFVEAKDRRKVSRASSTDTGWRGCP